MKKFADKTDSGKEPSIKTGNSVPADAVNLAYYTSKEISPQNNISILDLSSLIPENINQEGANSKIMFANEVGVLEDENGNPFIESDDIYISDMFTNNEIFSQEYSLDQIKKEHYINNYYVSRFFTLLKTRSYVDMSMDSFVDNTLIPNSIKVLDKNGNIYSDPETGRLKYRISFESFITSDTYKQNEIPHKIIVYIEDVTPESLTLVYDKVEIDQSGNWKNQILKYSETINSIPIYTKVQEESEVLDPMSNDRRVFSVKRNTKRSKIDGIRSASEQKYITVGRRAIDDNRLFEIFNWRIVASVQSSVDFSEIDSGYAVSNTAQARNTVNAAVLYSSNAGKNLSQLSAYAIANLATSSFNLANYQIVNPYAEDLNPNSANYWLVDIDSITEDDIVRIWLFNLWFTLEANRYPR